MRIRSVLSVFSILLLPLVAACDDDSTGPDRLTAAEVAGAYNVCMITFDPEGSIIPPVDVRAAVFNLSDTAPIAPRLVLSTDRSVQLQYASGENIVLRQGQFAPRTRSVQVSFADPAQLQSTLLIPSPLELNFTASPKVLTGSARASVQRADYARLKGLDQTEQTNLPNPIEGTLSARFSAGTCS